MNETAVERGSGKGEYTEDEAIKALHRVAKRWPKKKLWLFSASGSLWVMRYGSDGKQRESPSGGSCQEDAIETIDIPNDGGDW